MYSFFCLDIFCSPKSPNNDHEDTNSVALDGDINEQEDSIMMLDTNPNSQIFAPAPLFCEFAIFVENLEAPTGIIQSQTLLQVSSEIFKSNTSTTPLPTYSITALKTYIPSIGDIFTNVAPTAFVFSVRVRLFCSAWNLLFFPFHYYKIYLFPKLELMVLIKIG